MGKSFIYCTIILLLCSCTESTVENTDTNTSIDSTSNEKDTSNIKITALDLNNTLVNYQNLAFQQINMLFEADHEEKEKILPEIIFELKIYKEDLKTLTNTTFDKGLPFVNAMIDLINFYIIELEENIKKEISNTPEDWNTYQEQFTQKEKEYFKAVASNQESFAQYHKIELIDK